MRRVLVGLLPWLAAAVVFAQTTPAPQARPRGMPTGDTERAAMAKLDGMVGRWEGGGWMDMGAGRSAFQGSETVQKKLRGVALLVEGDFTGKVGDGGQEAPVHTTLGVIFFDAKSGKYRFNSWLATGMAGERDLTLTSDGWQWEMQAGPMRIRYTARLTPGEWHEIGERSSDGTNWSPFFEMTLKKKP